LTAPDNVTPKNSRSVHLFFDHFTPREQNLEFSALATLSTLDFVLVDFGGTYYVQRPKNCAGMCYFAARHSGGYFTGLSPAAISGLGTAQNLISDETARLALGTPSWEMPGSRAAG